MCPQQGAIVPPATRAAGVTLRRTRGVEHQAVDRRQVQFSFGAQGGNRRQLQQYDHRRGRHTNNALHTSEPLRDRCHDTIGQNA
jgi:hypothetical protein